MTGDQDDVVLGVAQDDIILVSRHGMSVKFEANDETLRPMGRQTAGVPGPYTHPTMPPNAWRYISVGDVA
ncbi:hypothetical protein [Bifidobacterium xylocopae]|uniref:hypothetical protein n=1 Tax=Bifidobacterium xylocopae TaxID=2493119 RepID=UPI000DEADFAC|nr:hypothetical protein [Bifidobacterium xylocopae]